MVELTLLFQVGWPAPDRNAGDIRAAAAGQAAWPDPGRIMTGFGGIFSEAAGRFGRAYG